MDLGMTSDTGMAPLDRHYPLDLACIPTEKVDRIRISDFDSKRKADRGDSDIVEVS